MLRVTKQNLLVLSLLACVGTSLFGDSPKQIAEDFRAKATRELDSLNKKLEAAVVPITAALVQAGDTAGAKLVTEQLKNKFAGEPVLNPHPKTAVLWSQYDAARMKALEPVQKTAILRIELLLRSSEGKKLEVIDALADVRAEIEAGKTMAAPAIAADWTFHRTLQAKPEGMVKLNPDGTALFTSINGRHVPGKWSITKSNDSMMVKWADDEWTVVFKKEHAEVKGIVWPDTRYLIKAQDEK